jgi:hypothetical protein
MYIVAVHNLCTVGVVIDRVGHPRSAVNVKKSQSVITFDFSELVGVINNITPIGISVRESCVVRIRRIIAIFATPS